MSFIEGKVSIIIPVYNAEKFLQRTVSCILSQTNDNWELLLVDDCSTDKSKEIMMSYSDERIHCFYLDKNAGPAHARNVALQNATGQYIAFLDADDIWVSEKLEKQLMFMKENQIGFSFTSYEFADESGRTNGVIAHAPKKVGYKDILKSSTIAPSTAILDCARIEKELMYMPEQVRLEDAATWMKIMKTGIYAYGIDDVFTIYCRHKGAYSGNKLDAVWGKWKLYRKVEKMSFAKAIYYLVINTWAALLRRI